MGRSKETLKTKLHKYVSQFGNDILKTDEDKVFCNACEEAVNVSKKSQLTQHVNSSKHKTALIKFKNLNSLTQQFISDFFKTQKNSKNYEFNLDLCNAMIAANIPFNKLKNEKFREFLKKYTSNTIPDESALRKNYLPISYDRVMKKIRAEIENNCIWVSVDETMDCQKRCIANVIVGTLNTEKSRPYLINVEELTNGVNHSSIAVLVNESLRFIWPEGIRYERVLLLVTDAAKYMKKAGKGLKTFYPKLIHITCSTDAIHNVCDFIRGQFAKADALTANVKSIFKNSPERIEIFKQNTTIPLPPKPVITRWGTWIEAASYYAKNFEIIVKMMENFDSKESTAIRIVKKIISDTELKEQLIFIEANYSFLVSALKKLESQDLLLCEALKIWDKCEDRINAVKGDIGQNVIEKLANVRAKTEDMFILKNLSKLIDGNKADENFSTDLSLSEITKFRYAPINSCDIERSFSKYKLILSERRENLRMYMIVNNY